MKNFILLALLSLVPVKSFAVGALPFSVVPTPQFQFEFDHLAGNPAQKFRLGQVVREAHNTAVGTYDFAVLGGAIGTVNVGVLLPAKAIVTNVFTDTVTAPTSGGSATIAWGVAGVAVNTLKTALAYGSYSAEQAGVVVYGTPSGYVKLASAAQVTATIATAALTAGKIKIFINYSVSE